MKPYAQVSVVIMAVAAVIILFQVSQYGSIFMSRDASSYLSMIYFMNRYGFHQTVPNWDHGFNHTSFLMYPPLFAFASIPFYAITDSVEISYAALLLAFPLLMILLFYFNRRMIGLDRSKALLLVLFFMFNPLFISRMFRTGRLPELLGWFFFMTCFFMLIYYKDRKIDGWFYLFGILYSLLILSHPSTAILLSVFIVSAVLSKPFREKMHVIAASALGILLSSFWLWPFIDASFFGSRSIFAQQTHTVISSFPDTFYVRMLAIALPAAAIIFMLLRWKQSGSKTKDFLFTLPPLAYLLMFLFGFLPIIPPFSNVASGFHFVLAIFLASYFFLLSDFGKLKKYAGIAMVLAALFSLSVTVVYYTNAIERLDYTKSREFEVTKLFPYINGTYEITPFNNWYTAVSYATIKFNLNTTASWLPETMTKELADLRKSLIDSVQTGNCSSLQSASSSLKIDYIIGQYDECAKMASCGLGESGKSGEFCLYRV